MTFFVVVLSASPVDILSAMKALVLLCRPEQREGPGTDCHSECSCFVILSVSEESDFAFERLLLQILRPKKAGLRMTTTLSS